MALTLSLGLQIVFPEGRNVSQPLNDGREMLNDIIHLLFGIINRETESDGSMSSGEWNTHGPKDMGRLK
jgi:hypothetical protein